MKPALLALLVIAAACKEQPKPQRESSPRTNACAKALESFDRFIDTGADPDAPPAQRAQVKATVLERCVEDAWSEAALTCMRAANSSHAVFKCWNEQLTKAQVEAARKALATVPSSEKR